MTTAFRRDAPVSWAAGIKSTRRVGVRPTGLVAALLLTFATLAALAVAAWGVKELSILWSAAAVAALAGVVVLTLRGFPLFAILTVVGGAVAWGTATRGCLPDGWFDILGLVEFIGLNLAFVVPLAGAFLSALLLDARRISRAAIDEAVSGRRWWGKPDDHLPRLKELEAIPGARFFALGEGGCTHLVAAGRRVALFLPTVWPHGDFTMDADGQVLRGGRLFVPGSEDVDGLAAEVHTWREQLAKVRGQVRGYLVVAPSRGDVSEDLVISVAPGEHLHLVHAHEMVEAAGLWLAAEPYRVDLHVMERLLVIASGSQLPEPSPLPRTFPRDAQSPSTGRGASPTDAAFAAAAGEDVALAMPTLVGSAATAPAASAPSSGAGPSAAAASPSVRPSGGSMRARFGRLTRGAGATPRNGAASARDQVSSSRDGTPPGDGTSSWDDDRFGGDGMGGSPGNNFSGDDGRDGPGRRAFDRDRSDRDRSDRDPSDRDPSDRDRSDRDRSDRDRLDRDRFDGDGFDRGSRDASARGDFASSDASARGDFAGGDASAREDFRNDGPPRDRFEVSERNRADRFDSAASDGPERPMRSDRTDAVADEHTSWEARATRELVGNWDTDSASRLAAWAAGDSTSTYRATADTYGTADGASATDAPTAGRRRAGDAAASASWSRDTADAAATDERFRWSSAADDFPVTYETGTWSGADATTTTDDEDGRVPRRHAWSEPEQPEESAPAPAPASEHPSTSWRGAGAPEPVVSVEWRTEPQAAPPPTPMADRRADAAPAPVTVDWRSADDGASPAPSAPRRSREGAPPPLTVDWRSGAGQALPPPVTVDWRSGDVGSQTRSEREPVDRPVPQPSEFEVERPSHRGTADGPSEQAPGRAERRSEPGPEWAAERRSEPGPEWAAERRSEPNSGWVAERPPGQEPGWAAERQQSSGQAPGWVAERPSPRGGVERPAQPAAERPSWGGSLFDGEAPELVAKPLELRRSWESDPASRSIRRRDRVQPALDTPGGDEAATPSSFEVPGRGDGETAAARARASWPGSSSEPESRPERGPEAWSEAPNIPETRVEPRAEAWSAPPSVPETRVESRTEAWSAPPSVPETRVESRTEAWSRSSSPPEQRPEPRPEQRREQPRTEAWSRFASTPEQRPEQQRPEQQRPEQRAERGADAWGAMPADPAPPGNQYPPVSWGGSGPRAEHGAGAWGAGAAPGGPGAGAGGDESAWWDAQARPAEPEEKPKRSRWGRNRSGAGDKKDAAKRADAEQAQGPVPGFGPEHRDSRHRETGDQHAAGGWAQPSREPAAAPAADWATESTNGWDRGDDGRGRDSRWERLGASREAATERPGWASDATSGYDSDAAEVTDRRSATRQDGRAPQDRAAENRVVDGHVAGGRPGDVRSTESRNVENRAGERIPGQRPRDLAAVFDDDVAPLELNLDEEPRAERPRRFLRRK